MRGRPGSAPSRILTSEARASGCSRRCRDFDFEAGLENAATLSTDRRDAIRRVGLRAPLPIQATLSRARRRGPTRGLDAAPVSPERIAILVGGSNLTQRYVSDNREVYEDEPAYLSARYALHAQDTDFVAAVSEAFQILGEGYTVGASSSSGNAAIILAARCSRPARPTCALPSAR